MAMVLTTGVIIGAKLFQRPVNPNVAKGGIVSTPNWGKRCYRSDDDIAIARHGSGNRNFFPSLMYP
jgi:hypothetical protein